jgi:hypothetical protein
MPLLDRTINPLATSSDGGAPLDDPRLSVRSETFPPLTPFVYSSSAPMDDARGQAPPVYQPLPVIPAAQPAIVFVSNPVPAVVPAPVSSAFTLVDVPWYVWAGIAGAAYLMTGGRRGR